MEARWECEGQNCSLLVGETTIGRVFSMQEGFYVGALIPDNGGWWESYTRDLERGKEDVYDVAIYGMLGYTEFVNSQE